MACARRVSVSELLGDAEQRYFGEGFRAAQQSLTQVKLSVALTMATETSAPRTH